MPIKSKEFPVISMKKIITFKLEGKITVDDNDIYEEMHDVFDDFMTRIRQYGEFEESEFIVLSEEEAESQVG